jgi:peroxiredoxin
MAQLELWREQVEKAGASLVFVAAEKRGGMFKPEKFLAKHPSSFRFLLDEDRQVTKAYGVYHRIGLDAYNIARPATFVIGRDGKVQWIYVGSNQRDFAPMEQVMDAVASSSKF